MAEGDILDMADPDQILHPGVGTPPSSPEKGMLRRSLKDAEQDLILKTLQGVQGNRTRAAELLGISLRGLHYKLKALQQAVNLPARGNGNGNHHEVSVCERTSR
jgi:DNA-binding NtrC family response regulator